MHGVGDLGRKALLELGSSGVALYHVRQFREPGDPAVRDIPNMGLADEGEDMMFTKRGHRQVTDDDQVARLLGEAPFEVASGVLQKAGEEVSVGFSDTLGGLDEALPFRVLADGDEDLAHRPRDARLVHALLHETPLFLHALPLHERGQPF